MALFVKGENGKLKKGEGRRLKDEENGE